MWWWLCSLALAADWPGAEASDAPWGRTASGVQVQDLVTGTGAEVVLGAGLVVHYTGLLADGTVFDSSVTRNVPFSFDVGAHAVIRGWEDGVIGMRIGGRRRLVIPADQGYGARAVGPIPADSVLYFEIELLEITPPRQAPTTVESVNPDDWRVLSSGVRWVDVTPGDGARAKFGQRVCLDWVVFEAGVVVDQTYTRARCTWLRLDGGDLPSALQGGLVKMRTGGVRLVVTPPSPTTPTASAAPERTYRLELSDTGK